MDEQTNLVPEWMEEKKINESLFCREYLQEHPMIAISGTFFTVDGRVTDEAKLMRDILEKIEPYVTNGLSRKVQNLLEALRLMCYSDPLPVETDRIHVANGTVFLDGTFREEKVFCMNRLPVSYDPAAPVPEKWLAFLQQLLYPEDIPTLQEYMGYCLIPSNKGQTMLFLIGNGGEGKSRIGLVMRSLLGANMSTGSIAKVETSPFARADLEHRLVMVDDDMKLEALPQTNHLKTIVTAEMEMDLEKKGEQSYQGMLYARLMAFGNGALRALYDHSDGFYRRQLILSAKPKDKARWDDPFIAEKLCSEAEGIFLWALEGLKRLIQNGYHFTKSERTQANIEASMREGNNILDFMDSEGYFLFKADDWITSKDFYEVYVMWCDDNAEKPLVRKTFINYLRSKEQKYNLEYNNYGHNREGRRVWGFLGIRSLLNIF